MKRTRLATRLTAVVAAAALALTGCSTNGENEKGSAETVEIKHAQGTTEVPKNPKKIFSYDLAATDTLKALGTDVAGVAKFVYPEQMKYLEADKYTKIGGPKEPDLEKVAAEKPDLIIISGRTADAYKDLSAIAPTIDMSVDATKPLDSFEENTRSLAKIVDKEKEADEKLGELEKRIDDVKARAEKSGLTSMTLMVSGGKLTAYAKGSRFAIINDILGFKPAADVKSEGPHGESVSFEFVKEKNPGVIFAIDRDQAVGESSGESAKQVLDNALVNTTDAAKNNKIVYLDSASWYLVGYGLTTVPKMIDEVETALN